MSLWLIAASVTTRGKMSITHSLGLNLQSYRMLEDGVSRNTFSPIHVVCNQVSTERHHCFLTILTLNGVASGV
jgi:hypothetical protein